MEYDELPLLLLHGDLVVDDHPPGVVEYDELPLLLLHGDLVVEQTPQKIWLHPPFPLKVVMLFIMGIP